MSPTADEPLKICIRGLPATTELRVIQEELMRRGFVPAFMRHVPSKGKEADAGVFCVKLQRYQYLDAEDVFKIKKLAGMRVVIEAWRGRQGPPQCQRCQGFRHTAAECLREYRCVHCARPHPSKQCNRPNDIPTCANCRGPHAANDLSCPAMRRDQIAKAGIVLRNSGYELATPKSVEESTAPSSLMAQANGQGWSNSKRRREQRKAKARAKQTSTLELEEPKETDKPIVASGNVKSLSMQDPRPEQTVKGGIPKETSVAVSLTQHMPPTPPSTIQTVSQKVQQSLDGRIQEKSHPIAVPAAVEPITKGAKIETATNPDEVRAKVVYECVLILQNVLSAINNGHDPVPIILESIAKLRKDV